MKMKFLMVLVAFFCGSFFSASGYSFELEGTELVKNGTGSRTMRIIGSVYDATLWVPAEFQGKSAKEIIEADEPSAVTIQITSRLISRKRFVSAVSEGFEKAAESQYSTDKSEQFLALFDDVDINNGDQINLFYTPKSGVEASFQCGETKETSSLGTISGLDLKQALFAIWLGPEPVQASLRDDMLGK